MQAQYKILVVDDNDTNLAIFEELLAEDYDIRIATTGGEALEIAPGFQPDLVLLDVMMPGIDGYETCRQMRRDTSLQRTRIMMVSSRAMESEKLEGYQAGADDYITKPFDEEQFMAKVRAHLGHEPGPAGCAAPPLSGGTANKIPEKRT